MDPQRVKATPASQTSPLLARVWTLLSALGGADFAGALDSFWIAAWDQDLRSGRSTPQLAFMVRVQSEEVVRGLVTKMTTAILDLIQAADPVSSEAVPTMNRTEHLGFSITWFDLSRYAKQSRYPLVRLFEFVEPCWTIHDGWWIAALSRDHLERIIDAQSGLLPTLGSVADVTALTAQRASRTSMTIIQGDLAAQTLYLWINDLQAGKASLLNPTFWNSDGYVEPRNAIGFVPRQPELPGVVIVGQTEDGSPIDGLLQPGDRIIGVDGKLLSLTSPTAEMRRLWLSNATAGQGLTLRIERNQSQFDVVVSDPPRTATSVEAMGMKPGDAIRELASLASGLQFASMTAYSTQPDRYSARVSLRFRPASSLPQQ